MKINFVSRAITGRIFSVLLFSSLILIGTNKKNSASQAIEEVKADIFSPLSENSRLSEVDTDNPNLLNIDSDRMAPNQVNAARVNWKTYYQDTNPNLKGNDIIVKMDQRMTALFTQYPTQKDTGLVFHYGYSPDDNSLCYILSRGSRNSNDSLTDFKPFPADSYYSSDYYILLYDDSNQGNYREIKQDSACVFIQNYSNRLDVLYQGYNTPIADVPDHPHYVYHEGDQLNLFHSTYYPSTSELLNLRHIAGSYGDNNDIYFHLPVLISTNDAIANTYYAGYALDLGHLCPPKCNGNLLELCN